MPLFALSGTVSPVLRLLIVPNQSSAVGGCEIIAGVEVGVFQRDFSSWARKNDYFLFLLPNGTQ